MCLIPKTHLSIQIYIKIRVYSTYHTVHPRDAARPGSAILITENMSHYENATYETDSIQATTVVVTIVRYNFAVSAIFSPPRNRIDTDEYRKFPQPYETILT